MGESKEDDTIVNREPGEDAEEDFHPFDELREEYRPSAIKKITAADGMPTNYFENTQSDIPALSKESLVCMEDTSIFVVRSAFGFIEKRIDPSEVDRTPSGQYILKGSLEEVFPIRERCKHYIRQMAMFEHNASAKVHLRLCAARRTTEGTFMTLRDSAMWACSMREPRDLESETKLDVFDALKVEQGQQREYHSIFSKGPGQ